MWETGLASWCNSFILLRVVVALLQSLPTAFLWYPVRLHWYYKITVHLVPSPTSTLHIHMNETIICCYFLLMNLSHLVYKGTLHGTRHIMCSAYKCGDEAPVHTFLPPFSVILCLCTFKIFKEVNKKYEGNLISFV